MKSTKICNPHGFLTGCCDAFGFSLDAGKCVMQLRVLSVFGKTATKRLDDEALYSPCKSNHELMYMIWICISKTECFFLQMFILCRFLCKLYYHTLCCVSYTLHRTVQLFSLLQMKKIGNNFNRSITPMQALWLHFSTTKWNKWELRVLDGLGHF